MDPPRSRNLPFGIEVADKSLKFSFTNKKERKALQQTAEETARNEIPCTTDSLDVCTNILTTTKLTTNEWF